MVAGGDSQLGAGGAWRDVRFTTGFRRPPAGVWRRHLVAYEYDSSLPDNGATTQIGATSFTGTYTVSGGDGDDGCLTATAIEANGRRSGSITSANDADYYRVEVPSRGELTVETTGNLDTFGHLLDAAGRDVADDDDGGAGRNFRFTRDVAEGTYHVRVSAYSSNTGSYTLRLQHAPATGDDEDHNDTRAEATPIELGTDAQDAIDHAGDVDWWRFELPSRGDVTIKTTGTVDTVGRLVDASGNGVVEDDDGGSGTNFRIHRALDAGVWYVRVAGYSDNDTGGYTLRVDHAPDSGATTPDLVVESPNVDNASVQAGASFTLSARVRNGGDGAATATVLRYYRSTDATISTADTVAGTDSVDALVAGASTNESVELTAPNSAGTYYYGACVDPVTEESDRSNNCSASVAVTVTANGGGGGGSGGTGGGDTGGGGGDGGAEIGPPATTFRLGDVNGDGRADVLLRHADRGSWIYYAMGGTGGRLVRNLGLTPNTKWALAGVGDFNGDRHDDVLVRHTESGQWLYYAMDGAGGRLVRRLGLTPNPKWALAGVGDFNGDGHDDVLVRHTESGQWLYYAMDGAGGQPVRRLGLTPNPKWALAGVGDFNGDGHDDVLVRHTDSGQWLYYAMDGAGGRLVRRLGLTPNPKWALAGVGDFKRR